MRYVSKRSNYLSLIKESGPLSNDIDWGDSLLGRLINASIRKSNIAINAKRVDSVIKLLNDRFEELRINSSIIDGNEEVSKRINKLKISEVLKSLNNAIKSDESELDGVINHSSGSIKEIDSFLIKNGGDIESTNEYNVDGLLVKLNDFLEDLNKMKNTSSSNSGTASNVTNINSVGVTPATYNLYLKNLNYLFNISVSSQNGNAEKRVPVRDTEYVSMNESFDIPGLEKKIRDMNAKLNDPAVGGPEREVTKNKIKSYQDRLNKMKSDNNNNNNKNNGVSVDVKDVKQSNNNNNNNNNNNKDADVEQPEEMVPDDSFTFDKLKVIMKPFNSYLIQKDKEYGDSFKSLFKSISKDKSIFERHKQRVSKIYASSKRQMSVNENMDIILSDTDKFAKGMNYVYKKLKGKVLNHPTLVDYVEDISGFISSMNSILNSEEEIPKQAQAKNELFKYSSFIKEAVGDKIHLLFQKHLPDEYLEEWLSDDEEKKSLESELNKMSDASKNKKSIIIKGTDVIIEIVRLFNRAYKLHTSSYIPSGRSKGKVSQMTLREYDFIGSGTPPGSGAEPGYGPWRNNKVFQKWEDAVTTIIANPDYQVIFDKDTVIQAIGENDGEPDARVNYKGGKQGGGRSLLKFINEMMDGDKLYKTGAQSKFLKEYFDINMDESNLGMSKGEMRKINDVADKTKTENKSTPLEFKAVNEIKYEARTIHSITTNSNTIYLLFQDRGNSNFYFKYSENFYHLNKCLKLDNMYSTEGGDINDLDVSTPSEVFFASLPKDYIFKDSGELKPMVVSITDSNTNSNTKGDTIDLGSIKKMYSLNTIGASASVLSLDGGVVTSSGDKMDGRKYEEYKNKVK